MKFLQNNTFLIQVTIIAATALMIPLVILSYGYIPSDDALFYSAKAVSGKMWEQILVLQPEINPEYLRFGWGKIMELLHIFGGFAKDGLLEFAVVFQFSFFLIFPLFFSKYPEAWIGSIFVLSFSVPTVIERFLYGRPMNFSMAILATTFLLIGNKGSTFEKKSWIFCVLMIALGSYIHAPWFFFFLLPGFILAREWKKSFFLFLSIVLGILLGAVFTGSPLEFLLEFFKIYSQLTTRVPNSNFLVTELRPIGLNFNSFILLCLVFLLMKSQKIFSHEKFDNPIFWNFFFGALGGLKIGRIWLDIGVPMLAVWLTRSGEYFLECWQNYTVTKKLLATFLACVLLGVSLTADVNARWSKRAGEIFLDANNSLHKEWLPKPGGVLFTPFMEVFYDTFFANPKGEWKYIIGFDSSLMPDEDYEIFLNLLWNRERFEFPYALIPWIKKMTENDSMVVRKFAFDGEFLGLKWKYLGGGISVGKKKSP